MSLAGSAQPGQQQYVGPSVADALRPAGVQGGPTQFVWPGGRQYVAFGQQAATQLATRARGEGRDPADLVRRLFDFAAIGGVGVAAAKGSSYMGASPRARTATTVGAVAVAAVAFRARRDPNWKPDPIFSTGSTTRDAARLIAGVGGTVFALGWAATQFSKMLSLAPA